MKRLLNKLIEKRKTLEFKMTKPRETFHFNPPTQIKSDWMIGSTDLEVYNSIFIINTSNNKFELCKFPEKILVVFHVKKLDMRLRKTWMFRILQLAIYKME